jgi:hypothetical protein
MSDNAAATIIVIGFLALMGLLVLTEYLPDIIRAWRRK